MFGTDDARRNALKQERQTEMQMFLAQQAQVNPRLRKLRAYQPDVVVSIADPAIGDDAFKVESGRSYGPPPPSFQPREGPRPPPGRPPQSNWQDRNHPPPPQQASYSYSNAHPYNSPHQLYTSHSPAFGSSQPRSWDPNPFAHTTYTSPYDRPIDRGSGSWYTGLQEDDRYQRERHAQSNQYAQDLKQQMQDDRMRRDMERGSNRGNNPTGGYYQHYHDRGQAQPGGMVGQQPEPYFGGNQRQQVNNDEGPHFGRRMGQQINMQHNKGQYLQDLNEQVRIKKEREMQEKQKILAEELKKEKEMQDFNPWGKAGGGAPLRKTDGSINTNLRNSRHDPNASPNSVMPQLQSTLNPYLAAAMQHDPMQGHAQQQLAQNQMAQQLGMNFLSTLQQGFSTPYGIAPPVIPGAVPGLSSLGQYGVPSFGGAALGMPSQQINQQSEAPKSFLRGQISADQIPEWQRAQLEQKHRAQLEMQDALKKQVQEREQQKAKAEAIKKEEELREQERVQKEQEMLRQRYARELEEQRKKEADVAAENERKLTEKVSKLKEQESQREKSQRDYEEKENRKSLANLQRTQSLGYQDSTASEPVPFRSSSPPIPTLRGKKQPQAANNAAGPSSVPEMTAFRSDSPPIPALQHQRGATNADGTHHKDTKVMFDGNTARQAEKRQKEILERQRGLSHAKVETSAVLEQLLSIQRELEDQDQRIKQDLSAPLNIASRKKEPKKNNLLEDILASHQTELDLQSNLITRSKFYIPSVLEQQREILAQQDREIRALKEEGKRSQSRIAHEFKQKMEGRPRHASGAVDERMEAGDRPQTESNFKTYKYLKSAEDFFGTEKHKLEFRTDKLRSESKMLYPDQTIRDMDPIFQPSLLQSIESSAPSSRANSAMAKHGRLVRDGRSGSGSDGSVGSMNVMEIQALNDERLRKLRELDVMLTRHPDHIVNDFLLRGQS